MQIKIPRTLGKYILDEFLLSFVVSFLFYFFIFFLNQLLLMAQTILAKGIPLGSVLLLLLYSLPSFITLSAPFSTLTAALMTYGRFSSDNEILAMRSAGFNKFMVFQPVLVMGLTIAVLSFAVNDFLLPAGTRAFQELWLELSLTHPGLELESYSVRNYRQSILVTGAIDDSGIHPMMIIERDNNGNRNSIIARRASSNIRGKTEGIPGFRLDDVFSLTPDSRNMNEWTWSSAESMDYRLVSGDSGMLDFQSGPANMRASDVRRVIAEKQARQDVRLKSHREQIDRIVYSLSLYYAELTGGIDTPGVKNTLNRKYAEWKNLADTTPEDHSLQIWKLEYYQKFAIPFSCIPFVILAFPLGLSAKRSGRAVGFFIGLLLTSFYWALLVLGRSLGLRSDVSPFLVMVVPNLLLLMAGVVLYFRKESS